MSGFVSSSAEIGFARAGMLGNRMPQAALMAGAKAGLANGANGNGVAGAATGTKIGAYIAAGQAKARAAAEEFEAVFVNTMFQQMFTGIDGDGPFGGSKGVGVWRSFLTDEYAKSFVKSGGIGLADQVYRELLAQQEARSAAGASPQKVTR